MIKFILAALLALLPAQSFAQSIIPGSSGGGSSGLVVGSTVITGGTNGALAYDHNGVYGETTTPNIGAATGTSLALGGATLGSNALAVVGTSLLGGNVAIQNGVSATTLTEYQNWSSAGTNYEGCYGGSWLTNVCSYGTTEGGTGVVRNVQILVGGVNKLDYGITNASTWTFAQSVLHASSVTLTNGAAAAIGTLTNAPIAGNPTKWVPINDNGTTRYIPAW